VGCFDPNFEFVHRRTQAAELIEKLLEAARIFRDDEIVDDDRAGGVDNGDVVFLIG
jgi:hypothetical protein